MPRTIKVKLIRNEFPATYRYSLWLRIFKLLFAFAVCLYAFYFVVKFVSAETPMFFKVLPLIILFIALDGMFKQLMAL
ncbi:MAG TPA: hypothetical protein P5252_08380, partial [Candidatus Cloacimonas sp.]|nr:hypothetical protein [Candidatus Cloacimonas sp.]